MVEDDTLKDDRVSGRAPAPLSPTNEAILRFGTDLLVKSIGTIDDFTKTMITLTSGFFAAYFALLKFLGVEDVMKSLGQTATHDFVMPPIFFILGIISFVVSSIPPLVVVGGIDLSNIGRLDDARRRILRIKYIPALVGMAVFLYGLYLTMILSIKLLLH